jgi:hypothetical protein
LGAAPIAIIPRGVRGYRRKDRAPEKRSCKNVIQTIFRDFRSHDARGVARARQTEFQPKPNLAKSNFGEMPAPTSMTLKITHEEPKLTTATKQSSEMGDFEMQATYTTDGKECTN